MDNDVPCGCSGETGGVNPATRKLPDSVRQARKQTKKHASCPACLTRNYTLACRDCLTRPDGSASSGVLLPGVPPVAVPEPETHRSG